MEVSIDNYRKSLKATGPIKALMTIITQKVTISTSAVSPTGRIM